MCVRSLDPTPSTAVPAGPSECPRREETVGYRLQAPGPTYQGTPDMKDDERPEPTYTGDERATLTGFLDFQRATLEWKCDALSGEQLRQRSVATSAMSLLGLVRHLADVEQSWFRVSLD